MSGNLNGFQGRPTAAELIAAVAEFLENDIRQAATGQINFHARVAANALRIVERELLIGDDTPVRTALAEFGFADEAELAAAIRAGQLDKQDEKVALLLRTLVRHRLAVSHPGYDQPAGPAAGR